MGSYIKGPPNPANSPNEKIEAVDFSNPAEAQRVFTQSLISNGVDPALAEQIGKAYESVAELKGHRRAEVQRQIQDWHNIHTHSGSGSIELALEDIWTDTGFSLTGDDGAAHAWDLPNTSVWRLATTFLNRYNLTTNVLTGGHASPPSTFGAGPVAGIRNGKMVIIGYQNSGATHHPQVYDIATDTWESATSRASDPHPYLNAAGCLVGSKLYAFGGSTLGSVNQTVAHRYDIDTDVWEELAPLPAATRSMGQAAFVPGSGSTGKIFVGGGIAGGAVTDVMYAYDIDTDSWETRTPIPTVNTKHGLAVVSGLVYLTAGNDASVSHGRHHSHSPAGNTWTTLTACPAVGPKFSFEWQGKLYAFPMQSATTRNVFFYG